MDGVASDNRNIFAPSSGDQKSEIKVAADQFLLERSPPRPSPGFWRLQQPLPDLGVWMRRSSLCPSLCTAFSPCVCVSEITPLSFTSIPVTGLGPP